MFSPSSWLGGRRAVGMGIGAEGAVATGVRALSEVILAILVTKVVEVALDDVRSRMEELGLVAMKKRLQSLLGERLLAQVGWGGGTGRAQEGVCPAADERVLVEVMWMRG